MKVGDLVICKKRYVDQKFLVIDLRDVIHPRSGEWSQQVKSVRISDGFKTRWSKGSTWETISESR